MIISQRLRLRLNKLTGLLALSAGDRTPLNDLTARTALTLKRSHHHEWKMLKFTSRHDFSCASNPAAAGLHMISLEIN